jgi:hypothetical protein
LSRRWIVFSHGERRKIVHQLFISRWLIWWRPAGKGVDVEELDILSLALPLNFDRHRAAQSGPAGHPWWSLMP